jgi:hypothetical protein
MNMVEKLEVPKIQEIYKIAENILASEEAI